jgi:hypothetical protein
MHQQGHHRLKAGDIIWEETQHRFVAPAGNTDTAI